MDILVIAEQFLNKVKAFSASHTAPPVSRMGVHKKLGGDTAGTADPNWPKGYPLPYDVIHSKQSSGRGWASRGDFQSSGICLPE